MICIYSVMFRCSCACVFLLLVVCFMIFRWWINSRNSSEGYRCSDQWVGLLRMARWPDCPPFHMANSLTAEIGCNHTFVRASKVSVGTPLRHRRSGKLHNDAPKKSPQNSRRLHVNKWGASCLQNVTRCWTQVIVKLVLCPLAPQ